MILRRDWDQFREQFPELAETVKTLGASIYEMGAMEGGSSKELKELCSILAEASSEARHLLGISTPLESPLVLRSVFTLGAQMLFNLEQGRSC
ncbi:MAG: hypothetical protein JWM39_180 [Parcubacteria group bacterium]|jgi:hypothetical protein|nr:hypothetical protein [Parcubacteria group bacterium]